MTGECRGGLALLWEVSKPDQCVGNHSYWSEAPVLIEMVVIPLLCPPPPPPPPGSLHRAADNITSAFIRASKEQRWRGCHLWSPQIRTDTHHFTHLYLRCHSRGKPGSRAGLGMSTQSLYSGSHSRGLDKGCLGERTRGTRICILTLRKIAGVRETPNNFQWASRRHPLSGKGQQEGVVSCSLCSLLCSRKDLLPV